MSYRGRLVAISVAVTAVACGGVAPDAAPPTEIPSVCVSLPVVSPFEATLHPGDTLRVTGQPEICLFGPVHYRWLVSDTTVATIDSMSGLVRARAPGVATVVGRVVEDPTVSGGMLVRVVP